MRRMLTDPFSTNRLTSTIIGSAIKVHRVTGPGLLESAYLPCLLFELRESGVSVCVQYPIPLVYKGIHLEAGYRADMVVDDIAIVELKSVESLSPIHTAQMLTYLKLSRKPVGLLINFNVAVLKDGIKRILNPEMAKGDGSSSGNVSASQEEP
ncbi:MAG: GxxExxY protein [Vicinamibacterales bacterium]